MFFPQLLLLWLLNNLSTFSFHSPVLFSPALLEQTPAVSQLMTGIILAHSLKDLRLEVTALGLLVWVWGVCVPLPEHGAD